jgi:amino acid transporter
VQELSQASAPLDELSTRFISGNFAIILDCAAAISALACAIGSSSAAGRTLYALSRTSSAATLAEFNSTRSTPTYSLLVIGLANLVCLLTWGPRFGAVSYSGNVATIGTLALILVYISVTGAQAIDALRRRRSTWFAVGCLGAVLLIWPLWNSVYPAPHWPENAWPYVVMAWLMLGMLFVLLRPSVARIDLRP